VVETQFQKQLLQKQRKGTKEETANVLRHGFSDDTALSRNDSIEVWVERATGPLWRATRPTRLVRLGPTI
jgi:hypothetical protein